MLPEHQVTDATGGAYLGGNAARHFGIAQDRSDCHAALGADERNLRCVFSRARE